MKFSVVLLSAAAALALSAASAGATPLVVDSGWHYDQDDVAYGASTNGPWTFTVGAGQTENFSLVDGFIAGDMFVVTVSGDASFNALSSFGALPLNFNDNLGPDAVYFTGKWTDTTFSRLQLAFGAGTYAIDVADISSVAYPAGFGVRLDSPGVPEPATWALMLSGFGLAGLALRRRHLAVAA